MNYYVDWSRKAIRDLKHLDKPASNRIIASVDGFSATGRGDVKKLTNTDGEYRLRVGDWRVRFTKDDEVRVLSVIRELPRGEAYKRM